MREGSGKMRVIGKMRAGVRKMSGFGNDRGGGFRGFVRDGGG